MHHWLRSDGRPCYPTISLPYALPNLFPYHMHPIPHHTTLPLILSYLATPTFPSSAPSFRITRRSTSHATLSQHPSFLLPLHSFSHPLLVPTCLSFFLVPTRYCPSSAFPMCE